MSRLKQFDRLLRDQAGVPAARNIQNGSQCMKPLTPSHDDNPKALRPIDVIAQGAAMTFGLGAWVVLFLVVLP